MSNYRWLNEKSQNFLDSGYLLPGQSVHDAICIKARRAAEILKDESFYDRFIENMQKGWYSLSTPIWTNFGTDRGLPISCFGSSIADTTDSISEKLVEVIKMSKYGGGTSGYFGNLRPRGSEIRNNGTSYGAVHFMSLFEKTVQHISQGNTRRGNFAAYLPITHPDVEEFLKIRGEGSTIQELFTGITVPDKWLIEMNHGDRDKRELWASVLRSRAEVGMPYIMFTDNAQNGAPDVYRDNNMLITHSNLCSEIMLPDNEQESFVCDLSSINTLYWDEWKDTDAVEILVFFLDAVMTEFIEKAKHIKGMECAVRFAERHRALGIGWLGWQSYLHANMIPFDSFEAHLLNVEIAKSIHDSAYEASKKLAHKFGEPEVLKGYGRRNTTLLAIAPTKSSSFILGQVSEGIEPSRSNYSLKDTAKGKYTVRNPYLEKILQDRNKDTWEVWESILAHGGSVQHLDFLTDDEKNVFKIITEISPYSIINQAAARQKYIDQGQSLNLMIHPSLDPKEVNKIILHAWEQGIKSLYYQYSVNAAQEVSREILDCKSCSA